MSVIYRKNDRIKVRVDGLTLTISPLSYKEKCEIQAEVSKGDLTSAMNGSKMAVKYALKDIAGVKDSNGERYELEKDEQGYLTDECIDDLFNLQEVPKLTAVCLTLLTGVPQDFVDPSTGKKLKGISIVKDSSPKK